MKNKYKKGKNPEQKHENEIKESCDGYEIKFHLNAPFDKHISRITSLKKSDFYTFTFFHTTKKREKWAGLPP